MRKPSPAPLFFQSLHTDEFGPPPVSAELLHAVKHSQNLAETALDRGDERFWSGRQGTAAGLIALNHEYGNEFYAVPPAAVDDLEAANEALGGNQTVIDAQVHYVADRPEARSLVPDHIRRYRAAMPSWWKGLDDMVGYGMAEFLRCVFVETETAVAVLTSGPGRGPARQLFNEEIAATRRLLDELAPRDRLLNHAIVHPTSGEELELMGRWATELKPVGWKVYTMGEPSPPGEDRSSLVPGGRWEEGTGWMLDEEIGSIFLDRVQELTRVGGTNLVCAHKGLSGLVDTGTPRDVGPAATRYPDLKFLIYHSGYEWPTSPIEEGAYSEAESHLGSNRLVKSLHDSAIPPGQNVYAELGSTWFLMARRPREAAHVLGKLLNAVGEDNVIWGTDSIWYGPTQQLIDAFRAFEIPVDMQQEFGYPALTKSVKEKILSLNAARLYGIDLEVARRNAENDDLVAIKDAIQSYRSRND